MNIYHVTNTLVPYNYAKPSDTKGVTNVTIIYALTHKKYLYIFVLLLNIQTYF